MAKFKEGDRITDGNAVYEITDVDDGIYEWKFVSGKADPSHSEGGEIAWAEGKMRLANSARNAKFRLGDRVEFRGVKGTVKRVVEGRDGMPTSYKIKGDDGEVYTPSEWDVKYVGNSASLASTNAVVQNAINARRARNAGDLSAPFQAALSAVRKLAEEAKKINPDHEVYKDAVKAGTALLRVKPKW